MRIVNNYVFIDEVEHNVENNPTMFYMCIVIIEREVDLINRLVIEMLSPLGNKGFHAKKVYKKNSQFKNLTTELTNLIIDNKLLCICFSYSKKYTHSPRLKVLQEISFKGWDFDIQNYRQVGYYFLLHVLNSYLFELGYMKKYRLVVDEDVLKKYHIMYPGENGVLNNIEGIYGASPKQAPILNLSDHIGFLFGKCLRSLEINDSKMCFKPVESQIEIFRLCRDNLFDIASRGLFKYYDIWNWIDYENNKTSK